MPDKGMIINIIYMHCWLQTSLEVNYSNPQVKATAPFCLSHTHAHVHTVKYFCECTQVHVTLAVYSSYMIRVLTFTSKII